MIRTFAAALLTVIIATQSACSTGASVMSDRTSLTDQTIAHALDSFHAAASRADFDGYFAAFTPDGVFLGTDATERWTVEEFKAYCKPYFDQGKGWTYLPRQRQVKSLGDVAWVDEVLEHEKYGMCRGTALMVRDPDRGWLVARYSLAFLIPNDVAAEATALGKK